MSAVAAPPLDRAVTSWVPDFVPDGLWGPPAFRGLADMRSAVSGLGRPSVSPYGPAGGSMPEGRAWRLAVSPGTVGVRSLDVARAALRDRALAGWVDPARTFPWEAGDPHPETLMRGEAGALTSEWLSDQFAIEQVAEWCDPDSPEMSAAEAAASRRQITEWSRKSRARMCRVLASLDWAPLFRPGAIPAMVTLTYPGDWQTVARTGRTVKRHMRAFQLRWRRAWAVKLRGTWKLELQARGAPHVHMLVPVPKGLCRGQTFPEWLSATWADIVAHPDPDERAKHARAGTGVDYAEGMRATDPRRLAVYFAGHSLKHRNGKEYQHVLPEEWREPGAGPGRWWGYWGLEKAVIEVDLTVDEYVLVRRLLRRYSGRIRAVLNEDRSVRMPAMRRVSSTAVFRVDTRTGVLRMRHVRRRVVQISWGGMGGGTLLVNDGFAVTMAVVRYVLLLRESPT